MLGQESKISLKSEGGLSDTRASKRNSFFSGLRRIPPVNLNDSFVHAEGPHKSVQCLISPPPRGVKKNLKDLKSDFIASDVNNRTDEATLQTVERYLKLDTALKDSAIAEILKLVGEPTLSNLHVVKKIRSFFPGQISMWQGLSVYIIKTIDPTGDMGEKRKRKKGEFSTVTETEDTANTESTRGSSGTEEIQLRDETEISTPGQSKASPPLSVVDAALNTNLSRSRSVDVAETGPDPSDAAGGLDPVTAPAQAPTREDDSSEISSSSSSSGSGGEIPIISTGQTTTQSPTGLPSQRDHETSEQREGFVGVLMQSFKSKGMNSSKYYSRFLELAMKIRRGVAAIRAMVKLAAELRKTFSDEQEEDEPQSEDELSYILQTIRTISQEMELGRKSVTDDLSSGHTNGRKSITPSGTKIEDSSSSSGNTDFEENALAQLFGGKTPPSEYYDSNTPEDQVLFGKQYDKYGNEYTIKLSPTGQVEYFDAQGRKMVNVNKMMQHGQKFYDEHGREIVDIFNLTRSYSKRIVPSNIALVEDAGATTSRSVESSRFPPLPAASGGATVTGPQRTSVESSRFPPLPAASGGATVTGPQRMSRGSVRFSPKHFASDSSTGISEKRKSSEPLPSPYPRSVSDSSLEALKQPVSEEKFSSLDANETVAAPFQLQSATPNRRKFYDEKGREILNVQEYVSSAMHRFYNENKEEIINIHGKTTLDIGIYDEDGREVVALPPLTGQHFKIFNEKGEEVVHSTKVFKRKQRKSKGQKTNVEGMFTRSNSPYRDDEKLVVSIGQRKTEDDHLIRSELLKKVPQQPGTAGSVLDVSTCETRAAKKSMHQHSTPSTILRPPPSAPFADMPMVNPVADDSKILVQEYMAKHSIHQLFEMFLSNLVVEQPTRPLDYLINLVHEIGVSQRQEKRTIDLTHLQTVAGKDSDLVWRKST